MSVSASLQKAIKLQEKIEQMRGLLADLLSKARQELALGASAPAVVPRPRRRARRGTGRTLRTPERVAGAARPGPVETPALDKIPPPKRGGKGQVKGEAPRRGKTKIKGGGRRSLAGQKRAASPSGPLAPAVVKVIEGKGGPMRVAEILEGLLEDGYSFNASDPKKNLAARIYRLRGVSQVEPGLFTLA